ncbi:MAG: InlB B-repeat-containing protein, partial [Roseimicrobium sp.]
DSVPGHPKCRIRWESKKNANGTWAAYTAIPAGPISPTNGHMFTNPNVNFGGEHFGVGYRVAVGAVLYHWLLDNGAGQLVRGGAVQVSTPTFTYFPAAAAGPAQVQAVIAPPPPPAPPVKEFGPAVWVKEIRTTSHNNAEVKLRDLVSDDPDDVHDKNWKNGEPDEVEVEWQILQKDFHKADGGPNNEVAAAAEDLPGGNEVVTRRYEFYKYTGPFDNESGEAMCENIGPDGIHGEGVKTINGVEVDLATVIVVGEFTGAQMAAVDVDAGVGLIDHVGEGRVNRVFAPRTVAVGGALPFTCTHAGTIPPGMTFNDVTGVLSGTPTTAGQYQFSVTASDGVNPEVKKNYTMTIAAANAALAAASLLDTTVHPVGTGTTTGDGSFAVGSNATVTATPAAGYKFLNWTDNSAIVSTNTSYTLAMDVNHSLIANFAPDVLQWNIATSAEPAAAGTTAGGGLRDDGANVTVTAIANAGFYFVNWTENGTIVSANTNYTFTASADRALVANFTALPTFAVTTSAAPSAGGSTAGDGSFVSGTNATVTATPNAGYFFVNWTVGSKQVSANPSYTFAVTASRALVANFALIGNATRTIATASNPLAGGTTTGGGVYADGTSITVEATPAPGYEFSKWKQGSSTVSNSASFTFNVSVDRTLTAIFTPVYVMTSTPSPAQGGEVEIDSPSYKPGDDGHVDAFPAPGWEFVNWTENGTVVSTDPVYDVTNIQANHDFVANFALIGGVSIATAAVPAAGGSTLGAGSYMPGQDVTVTAVPNEGYAFDKWTLNGATVSIEEEYTFIAAVNRSLIAHFVQSVPYTITANAAPTTGGTVTGAGIYQSGRNVTLTAMPNAGYVFTNW